MEGLTDAEASAYALAAQSDKNWFVWQKGMSDWVQVKSLKRKFPFFQKGIAGERPKLPVRIHVETQSAKNARLQNKGGQIKKHKPTESEESITSIDRRGLAGSAAAVVNAQKNRSVDRRKINVGMVVGNQINSNTINKDYRNSDFSKPPSLNAELISETNHVETLEVPLMTEPGVVPEIITDENVIPLSKENVIRRLKSDPNTVTYVTEAYRRHAGDPRLADLETGVSAEELDIDTTDFIVRSSRRFRKRIPIDIECDGQQFSTYSVDISLGGLFLEDPLPVWVSGYSKVRMKNEQTRQIVELTCYIVENQRPDKRYRVALLPLRNSEDKVQLENWIKAA